jgi:integrase/recombinase XerD
VPILVGQLGIAEAVRLFRVDCLARRLRPKTLAIYDAWLTRESEFLSRCGVSSCAQVNANHLRAFFADLNETRLSPATVNQAFCKLHAFWKWSETEELIVVSPMARLHAPPVPKKLVPRLSEAQMLDLLAVLDSTAWPERNRALVLLMLDSGLRRGEATGLMVSDVDLVIGCVRVWGKGARQRAVPIGDTTTRALDQ